MMGTGVSTLIEKIKNDICSQYAFTEGKDLQRSKTMQVKSPPHTILNYGKNIS